MSPSDLGFTGAKQLFGRAPLSVGDLPAGRPTDDTRLWASVSPSDLPRAIAPLWLAATAVLVLHALLAMVAPPVLRALIAAVRDPEVPMQRGVWLAVALALSSSAAWFTVSHGFLLGSRVAMRVRASLVSAIYRKALRQASGGESVINLIANDADRVASGVGDSATLVMSLVYIAVGVTLLFSLLGPSALAGLMVLAAMIPLSSQRARRLEEAGEEAARAADRRLTLLREVIAGIGTVKLSRWESTAEVRISEPRGHELLATRRFANHAAWLHALFLGSPVVLVAATFGLHAALGRPLIAADAFAAIALFGILRPSLLFLPGLVVSVAAARVSARRIIAHLAADELAVVPQDGVTGALTTVGASFCWPDGSPALTDVDLAIAPGELVVVMGPVGAGKSALLAAVLGELALTSGSCHRAGRIAAALQRPFLVHGTVQDNVLFGRALDETRYNEAIAAVGLDLDVLPDDVGERGSRLSGGQQQRVGLARALYGDADLVLLDEPVSALDSAVADLVVERTILGAWRGKTRIVVSHRPSIVARADRVLVVADGRVTVRSSVSARPAEVDAQSTDLDLVSDGPGVEVKDEGGRSVGGVLYRSYLNRLLPGAALSGIAALFAVRELLAVGADYWLSWWSERGQAGMVFVLGLCVLGGLAAVATFVRGLVVALRGVSVGKALHDDALHGLLHAPMRLFETTRIGLLLQRFGPDQRTVDQRIALVLLDVGSTLALVVSTLVVIGVATPWALLAFPPAAWLCWRFQAPFRPACQELRRFEAASHAPLLALVAETLQGLSMVRAYGMQELLTRRLVETLEPSQRALYADQVLRGWLSIRLEGVGSLVAGAVALAAVLGRAHIDQNFACLAITDAMLATYTLGRWVRTWAELDSALTSVERLGMLADVVPEEREPPAGAIPEASGRVSFEDVDLRYADALPLALRGVRFELQPGEHVAIAGRTGSGKSTLAAALVRFVRSERGVVRVDGVDVGDLPLAVLRARVSVVPQEPVLFEGRLRDSLDLAGEYDDTAIDFALARVGLSLGSGTAVRSGGGNLSAGQRQLVCLARALLSGARIVVLDEATAHLDPVTEAALRATITRELACVTVITIAHRTELLTVATRLLVMEEGRLHEQPLISARS